MSKQQKVSQYQQMFSGVIGQEYEMLKLICPLATEMSRLVGEAVEAYCIENGSKQTVVELGGGTGITTLSVLLASDALEIVSVDSEPTMQKQAISSLQKWQQQGRLTFSSDDALTALKAMDSNSVDIVASAYTIHNFLECYRLQVLAEIYRVLKPAGLFVNGDRYGLDDISKHTKTIQQEVAGYFKVLSKLNKFDVLEHWIIHLFNDESENHVMRESLALKQMQDVGFTGIELSNRLEVNALLQARKA